MDPLVILAILVFSIIVFAFWASKSRVKASNSSNSVNVEGPKVTQLVDTGPPPSFDVVCVQGPLQNQRFTFERSWLQIGRQPENDIVISGSLVSRHHAVLIATDHGIVLKDVGSTNGTWVSGQQIDEHQLSEKEPFQVGPCVFVLTATGKSATPATDPNVIEQVPVALPPLSSVIRSLELQNYERLRVLGEGGAATVYLCREHSTEKLVAVKLLHNSADPYFKHKFQHESEVGQKLQHPHIVRTLGSGNANGLSYIFMEYMSGGSLRDVMQRVQFSLDQIVQIIGQICTALEFAHNRGIYHRDIKPENILFSEQGVAKLADFGIARLTSLRTVTQEGMLIGTPDYMSYEQAKGAEIDGRSDQYSLAIVLYECLAGSRPFTGDPLAVVGQHLSQKPSSPASLNSSIPKKIDRAIMKGLEKDKNRRHKNMLVFAEAIGYKPDSGVMQVTTSAPEKVTSLNSIKARIVDLQSGRVVMLNQNPATIGRDLFQGAYPQISRDHTRIWFDGYSYYIQDLGSLNGTFVNGIRVNNQQPVQIEPGCYVNLGPVQFQFLSE